MFVREWALERWEENTQVTLLDQLPALKRIIYEQHAREAEESAAEAEAEIAAAFEEEAMAAADSLAEYEEYRQYRQR